MSFFSLKKSFVNSRLMEFMTDIHSHILPGIDDGVRTYNEAVKSLRWLKNNGIRRMYLTPHIMSDFPENDYKFIIDKFNIFKRRLEEDGIGDIPELKQGAEYMLEPAFEKHKQQQLLTYSNRHVLVETSYMTPPVGFNSILERLMEDGYSPVLAHPERYTYMDIKDYKYLKMQGVFFQINILSLTGAYGRYAKDKAIQLLNNGFYNYAGTDFHHLSRHENSFITKSLTKKQTTALRCLINNNEELW